MVNVTIGGRCLGSRIARSAALRRPTSSTRCLRRRSPGPADRGAALALEQGHVRPEDPLGARHVHGARAVGPGADRSCDARADDGRDQQLGEAEAAHPDTRIVVEDGGIGREYDEDPLGGRDDDGPIFPAGDVDPRLPVQAAVVGVIGPRGEPVASGVDAARAA